MDMIFTDILISHLPWIWTIFLVVFLIIEAATFSLTTIWLALSCVPMIFISRFSVPLLWQLLIFSVLTFLLVLFTRPFAVKKLGNGRNKTNLGQLIGQEVLVTQGITRLGKGEVRTKNGVLWTAISEDNDEIKPGTVCTVKSIVGNSLCVSTSQSNPR